ncbi:MAG: tetratricopeptide repeat protein [Gaiellales bacterium]
MSVSSPATRTDYERDLEVLDELIGELGSGAPPADAQSATRLAHCHYRRASMAGRPEWLDGAGPVIEDGLRRFGPWPDLCLVKANVALALHRLDDVEAALALAPDAASSPDGRCIAGDVDLQRGRYGRARDAYQAAVDSTGSWDALARLAELERETGDDDAAERLFAAVVDELTAKQLRAYAWVELRWGELYLARGDLDEAEGHFRRADGAYSGNWRTAAHLARLAAARGDLDEAIELRRAAAGDPPRLEQCQALGDLHLRAGRPGEARDWHGRALDGYVASAERGEVHYLHHLAELCITLGDGAGAVRWAGRDAELRRNPHTLSVLERAREVSAKE